MATFWLTFADEDSKLLGVAILDMPEDASNSEIIKRSWSLGINPGGAVGIFEIPATDARIKDEHKNRLIRDEDLLLSLGSRGRHPKHLH